MNINHLTKTEKKIKIDKHHKVTVTITCMDCGGPRVIFKQDKHHVKRCKKCQRRFKKVSYKHNIRFRAKRERANAIKRERAKPDKRSRIVKKKENAVTAEHVIITDIITQKQEDTISYPKIII